MTSATPATQAFQAAMATYAPDVSPSESAAKAWTAGMVLQKALSNLGSIAVGGPITSATILQGLATIKHDSLGGLVMGQLNYNAGAPVTPNSSCWGVAELTGGKWIAPKGGSAQCT
jgi:hypothetical protein